MTTMAPPPSAGALDVRTFLLGEHGITELRERLGEALAAEDGEGGLTAFTGPVRSALDAQLAKEVEGFLDIDLGTTAMLGWQKHQDLRTAAQQTRDQPGLTQCVQLADHTLTSTWTPRLEVLVGPKAVARLAFELKVSFTLVGLSATVTDARLTRLGGGSGTVEASLAFGGRTVLKRTEPFDASVSVPLGAGVPLLGEADVSEAPSVVESPAAPAAPATSAARRAGARLRRLRAVRGRRRTPSSLG